MHHARHAGPGRTGRPSAPVDLFRPAAGGKTGGNLLLEPGNRGAAGTAGPVLGHGMAAAGHSQDPHPEGHPVRRTGHLPGNRGPERAGPGPVQRIHLSHHQGRWGNPDPHDLDRLALPHHLLELRPRDGNGHAEPEDRDHRGPASLAGKRLPLCRHHPAGQHLHGGGRLPHQHPPGHHAAQYDDRRQGHRTHRRVQERF